MFYYGILQQRWATSPKIQTSSFRKYCTKLWPPHTTQAVLERYSRSNLANAKVSLKFYRNGGCVNKGGMSTALVRWRGLHGQNSVWYNSRERCAHSVWPCSEQSTIITAMSAEMRNRQNAKSHSWPLYILFSFQLSDSATKCLLSSTWNSNGG